ncbi:MAG TPA: hypothetical protein ACFYD4_13895 [Candidatus Wunengus sp. YC61]
MLIAVSHQRGVARATRMESGSVNCGNPHVRFDEGELEIGHG